MTQRKGETYPAYMARMDAEGVAIREESAKSQGTGWLLALMIAAIAHKLAIFIIVLWVGVQLVKWMW